MDFRILDAGDTALTIELGDRLDRHLLAAVTAVDEALAKAIAGGDLPGIVETVPTFRSLTVIYDPLLTSRAEIEPGIRAAIADCCCGECTSWATVAAARVLRRPDRHLRT
jgi:inhibitor of KinA